MSMQLVAVDFLLPEVLQHEMLRVSSLLGGGHITPLRAANYSLTDVVAAMRLLAQASHVGKVRSSKTTADACVTRACLHLHSTCSSIPATLTPPALYPCPLCCCLRWWSRHRPQA